VTEKTILKEARVSTRKRKNQSKIIKFIEPNSERHKEGCAGPTEKHDRSKYETPRKWGGEFLTLRNQRVKKGGAVLKKSEVYGARQHRRGLGFHGIQPKERWMDGQKKGTGEVESEGEPNMEVVGRQQWIPITLFGGAEGFQWRKDRFKEGGKESLAAYEVADARDKKVPGGVGRKKKRNGGECGFDRRPEFPGC